MCDGLRRLGDIYNSVEEMTHLPSNQVCSSQQRKMLDGEIESSLDLLDLCNTMQEIFVELKAIIQELQMALRKGDGVTVQAKIQSYSRLVKKAMLDYVCIRPIRPMYAYLYSYPSRVSFNQLRLIL
jgi:hypothetical protein